MRIDRYITRQVDKELGEFLSLAQREKIKLCLFALKGMHMYNHFLQLNDIYLLTLGLWRLKTYEPTVLSSRNKRVSLKQLCEFSKNSQNMF